jgi:DNA-binding response OmpR family regulator
MQSSTPTVTMLIVDDDKSILRSLSRILEKYGYMVDTVETGKAAIEKIKKQKYDCVLLDIRLPDMKGTDLLKKAKNTIKDAVKIMITGFPTLETGVKSLEEGADAYLVKPVQSLELISVIENKFKEATNPSCCHFLASDESLDFQL